MQSVTIVSHLTMKEWKNSWRDKVVEDTRENMRAYQMKSCFWGHFTDESDFSICFHKESEIKSMSLGLYFNGHLEKCDEGTRVVGKFGKKWSANIFLAMGATLSLLAMIGASLRSDMEVFVVAAVLFAILMLCYLSKPKKAQQRILEHLKKISFDAAYHKEKHGK